MALALLPFGPRNLSCLLGHKAPNAYLWHSSQHIALTCQPPFLPKPVVHHLPGGQLAMFEDIFGCHNWWDVIAFTGYRPEMLLHTL